MMDPRKRLKIQRRKRIDRPTDLPIDIKHQIQEKLPVDEAAKMSVLSRPWRHHDGGIKASVLIISSINCMLHCVIDKWMCLLARIGPMDLTIQNLNPNDHLYKLKQNPSNHLYKLPWHMYSLELEKLDLFNCIFRSPCSFMGFRKLKSLLLHRVTLELTLQLLSCQCQNHLKIYAPKLMKLSILNDSIETLNLDRFIDNPKLETVALGVNNYQQDKVLNLTYLLNNWPEVIHLRLDCYYLKCFASGIEAERIPTCLNNLRVLFSILFQFQ
ncbi:hypothetical protein P3S67_016267 [Capsicum chacoense]